MCIFSNHAEVSRTNIFARAQGDSQYLVYGMDVEAETELAMILPLPVAEGTETIEFINLEDYPDFFKEIAARFPRSSRPTNWSKSKSLGPMPIVHVGSFIASYVPTSRDFDRVDEQFRLPDAVWSKLPQYKNYGFAIFQLKGGVKTIHPMALRFKRSNTQALYFPTVHVHHGEVNGEDLFDHVLYAQDTDREHLLGWEKSPSTAGFVNYNIKKTLGILAPDSYLYRMEIRGLKPNRDAWVG